MNILQTIPFSKLRHSDLLCYVVEGYGGQHIEEWPVYTFFCEYLRGEEEKAQYGFEHWYRGQLEKYHNTANEAGGMYNGSLYTLIEKRSGGAFKDASEDIIQSAIRERVEERFALLKHIHDYGYNSHGERIDGVKKGGYIYIHGGHHRAAALRALGKTELPGVLVFPNQFVYNLFCFLRNIKYVYF